MFITFEGPDGSGKSTQLELVKRYLQEAGEDVVATREPGGTVIGDQIRAVLHDVANTAMLPNTEILLYSASRAQIVGEIIRPALARGQVVLCDRYADSTMAYQGYGHQLDLDTLRMITEFATAGLRPDLTIYLDVPVELGVQRKTVAFEAGESELNRMDRKELAFHRRVRAGYLKMAAKEPERWVVLDGSRPINELQQEIRRHIAELLRKARRSETPS